MAGMLRTSQCMPLQQPLASLNPIQSLKSDRSLTSVTGCLAGHTPRIPDWASGARIMSTGKSVTSLGSYSIIWWMGTRGLDLFTNHLFSLVNIIAADDLSTQGTRALVAMLSTWITWIWLGISTWRVDVVSWHTDSWWHRWVSERISALVCEQWPEAGKVPAAAHFYADLIFSQMT